MSKTDTITRTRQLLDAAPEWRKDQRTHERFRDSLTIKKNTVGCVDCGSVEGTFGCIQCFDDGRVGTSLADRIGFGAA